MKKALILAGSRGIGRGIAESLKDINCSVRVTSSKELDTSDINSVDRFIDTLEDLDILVLNTGGPPAKNFYDITQEDCLKYHNQLFYSFFKILQNVNLKKGGYIFMISSFNIKEPDSNLILSNSYRIAFTSVLKSLTKEFAKNNVSVINIAPGPFDTDRIRNLVNNIKEFEKSIPMGRLGDVREIGNFVSSIIDKEIKFLTGVTINFDGGKSNYLL